jgi:hypothetical protein
VVEQDSRGRGRGGIPLLARCARRAAMGGGKLQPDLGKERRAPRSQEGSAEEAGADLHACCRGEKKTGKKEAGGWEKWRGGSAKMPPLARRGLLFIEGALGLGFFSWAKWAGLEWAWPKTRNRVALNYFPE